jgi:hypothetical protein
MRLMIRFGGVATGSVLCAAWMLMALGAGHSHNKQAPEPSVANSSLDYQVYKEKIQPIFLKRRADGVMCYTCHSMLPTRLRLQVLNTGNSTWTEEQSRQNFAVVSQLVTPSDPAKSRLLMHPLAADAGGDPTHTGGKFWKSKDDPEYLTIAEWVLAGASGGSAPSPTTPPESLDFEFFRARVEPIFLKKRAGHGRCYVCHAGGNSAFRLQKLLVGATSWTKEQSRSNFENVSQLVTPGDPTRSRLLMHPLAPEAGGDPFHSGGRQFVNQEDEDWRTMAEWVRGATAKNSKE